jgi:hypothetical protein
MLRPNPLSTRAFHSSAASRHFKRTRKAHRRKSQRLQLESLENRLLMAANVVTDQADYFPGETANIIASEFAVGETVRFQVLHIDGTPNTGHGHEPWEVTDGVVGDFDGNGTLDGDLDGVANGSIKTTWYVHPDDSAGSTFELTAAGLSSGEFAHTVFTDDGNDSPTNITTQPGWLDVNGANPVTTITAPAGFVITKVAIKSGNGAFDVPEPDNVDPGDDNTGDQHSGVIYADGTYGVGNGFTVAGLGTGTVTVTKNAGTKDISHVDYMLGAAPTGAIRGQKFQDDNGDGTKNGADAGLSGWTIQLDKDANGTVDATTVTDVNGNFSFTGLTAGIYRVREVNQVGWIQTTVNPNDVTVVSGTNSTGNNFGNFQLGAITGQKFQDNDGDGTKNGADAGLSGWTIELDKDANGTVDATTVTDINGNYSFTGLTAGVYRVREVNQVGWTQTTVNPNDVTVVSGTDSTGNNFGNFELGAIRGMKFNDLNGDGVKDPGDVGLLGWTIQLDQDANGTVDATTVTDINGNYSFTGLTAGVYRIREVNQPGWTQTTVNPNDVTIFSGTNSTGNDFGNRFRSIIIIGPDKGNKSAPIVRLVDQLTGAIVSQFYVYEPSFMGGVRIATGDMTGDGIDEIIVAPGQGRSPEVRVFTQAGTELTQFRTLAYDVAYKGGVEVAVGDVNGDGKNDIVTVPTNERTEVRVFYNNYNSALPLADPIANSPNKSFFVFDKKFKGGADVAVADVGTFLHGAVVNATTPDGRSEIIVGSGPGMRATVQVFDVTGTPAIVDTILPFDSKFNGGVTLSTARVNGDAIPDLIIAAGNKGNSVVQVYSGIINDTPDALLAAFATFGDTSTKNMPVHATAFDTTGDGIADVLAAVQGTNGKSDQIRFFKLDGTSLGSLSGFPGPWNIASLNGLDPNLPAGANKLVANDLLFELLADSYVKAKKKKK